MPCIINIETSTKVCSVAVTCDGMVAFNKEHHEGPSHASLLGGFVQEALDFIKSNNLKLDAVAVSGGPGSYTGLRIGVSMAKGLCFGYDVPLIALDTTEIMACSVLFNPNVDEEAMLSPMIDARRMEVYSAIYDRALQPILPISANIIDENSFSEILKERKVVFFGDGSDKCKDVIKSENAIFVSGVVPLAKSMLALSERAFRNADFKDTAYYQPFYLKEFQATIPKNKVLNNNNR
ncbi:MAG: tRNA (adenosine(37)-N6)-threonylcarbamoyltransferase complex dimerization subunit type 1 TsaB [Bacteroidales bacterium]|nr:tRNA (adenosine(37)-N6)-threonylcarbamoyltransferase complex dimerization subunit type 1 TsaB [Bacteroidales bacterium]MBQ7819142.1 tRNA (adenosine(37)-N6)-threonylcarbamoyltransferase complex dimerization subunit type 1 TsaB [Bacteroidales bacterium]